jgi:IclR family KDG regulon transcriptional repressor
MPQQIEAVVTTLNIIEHMAQARGPVGVSELALAIAIPKPRIYRHLRTLLSRGYVAQEPDSEKYGLTMRLSHIGRAIADQTGIQVEMRNVMPVLRARVHQSVVVGQIEDEGVRVLDILPPTLWKQVQRRPLRQWTDASLTDIDRLKAEVERVRKRGWAVAPGEVLSGINALAAPVFDAGGVLVATIGILGSIQHLAPRPNATLIAAVLDAAADFSRRLGYREVEAS